MNFWYQIMVRTLNPNDSRFWVLDDDGNEVTFHDTATDRQITSDEVVDEFNAVQERVQTQIAGAEDR